MENETITVVVKKRIPCYLLSLENKRRVRPSKKMHFNVVGGMHALGLHQLVYTDCGLLVPKGVKGHQSHKQATSIADMTGVDPQLICQVATWSSENTFAKHYCPNIALKAR